MRGHVWQGRFYSTPLDERHLWAATRYVERNPVRARMAERAETYRWSSAAPHCGLRADSLLSPDFPPSGVVQDWSSWLTAPEDEAAIAAIRRNTHTGHPCGSDTFLQHLQQLLNRALGPQKRGRKPKRPKPHAGQ